MTATIEEVRTHELTQFRWLPMGRSGGRHRAGFVSASGQVHVSLDTRSHRQAGHPGRRPVLLASRAAASTLMAVVAHTPVGPPR